jgi:sec-independent protein translocase protein TatA
MIGHLGLPELGIILVIAMLIFGPKALPSLGKSLGDGIRSLKKGLHAADDAADDLDDDERERRVQDRAAVRNGEQK